MILTTEEIERLPICDNTPGGVLVEADKAMLLATVVELDRLRGVIERVRVEVDKREIGPVASRAILSALDNEQVGEYASENKRLTGLIEHARRVMADAVKYAIDQRHDLSTLMSNPPQNALAQDIRIRLADGLRVLESGLRRAT